MFFYISDSTYKIIDELSDPKDTFPFVAWESPTEFTSQRLRAVQVRPWEIVFEVLDIDYCGEERWMASAVEGSYDWLLEAVLFGAVSAEGRLEWAFNLLEERDADLAKQGEERQKAESDLLEARKELDSATVALRNSEKLREHLLRKNADLREDARQNHLLYEKDALKEQVLLLESRLGQQKEEHQNELLGFRRAAEHSKKTVRDISGKNANLKEAYDARGKLVRVLEADKARLKSELAEEKQARVRNWGWYNKAVAENGRYLAALQDIKDVLKKELEDE